MPLPNDFRGTPQTIAGRSGSLNATTIGASPDSQDAGLTSDGQRYWLGAGVRYVWTPPWPMDSQDGWDPTAISRTPDLVEAPSGYMLMRFKVEADFQCVIMHNGISPRYATPGMGQHGAAVEFHTGQHSGFFPGPSHGIWIGGLARTGFGAGGLASGPTGNFKLSWDYSQIPTIGSPDEAAAFFDPAQGYARYIDRVVMSPFNAAQNYANFEVGAAWFFLHKPGQNTGFALAAGTYLVVFGGGTITDDETGFATPLPDTPYSSSPEESAYLTDLSNYLHATLFWSDGAASENLPYSTWDITAFFPGSDLPNAQHFTKWSMRYYWKIINHAGGRIWLAPTGPVGFSDTTSQDLGQYSQGFLNGKVRTWENYSGDPKLFLYKVGS